MWVTTFYYTITLKYNLIKSILKINFSKPYLSKIYLYLNVSNTKGLDLVLLTINIIIPQFHTLYTLHNWPKIKTNIDIPILSCPLPKTKSSINNFMPSTQVKSTCPIHPPTCHSLRQIGTNNGLVLMTWAWALMFMAFFQVHDSLCDMSGDDKGSDNWDWDLVQYVRYYMVCNNFNINYSFNPKAHKFNTSPNNKKTISPLKFFKPHVFLLT